MRVKTEWGEHSLVTAARLLLQAALENPLNQKFVLLSESGIPLYPPTTIYQQLLTEPKSRINACRHQVPPASPMSCCPCSPLLLCLFLA